MLQFSTLIPPTVDKAKRAHPVSQCRPWSPTRRQPLKPSQFLISCWSLILLLTSFFQSFSCRFRYYVHFEYWISVLYLWFIRRISSWFQTTFTSSFHEKQSASCLISKLICIKIARYVWNHRPSCDHPRIYKIYEARNMNKSELFSPRPPRSHRQHGKG